MTIWTSPDPGIIPGGPKPLIANPEIEYDVRALALNDGDPVATWPDSSGEGNDATGINTPLFVLNGWTLGVNAVRLQDTGIVPQDDEAFSFAAVPVFLNTEATFFAVFEPTDLSDGCAIIGSTSASTPPRIFSLFVKPDGSIYFTKGFDPYNVQSAPGVIIEGRQYIVSARLNNATGMILRVNGVEVGADASADGKTNILDWASPRLGNINDQTTGGLGGIFGIDKLFAWISGYSSPASDAEIGEMESFLAGVFQFNFGTEWVPS